MSNQNPLTNGSYWGPVGESPKEIQLEKLFLASGYLTGMAFGMQFTLYVACMRILWRESRMRHAYFLMAYTTLLCVTNVVLTVCAYIGVELAYIDYRNFPGGVFMFIVVSASLPSNIVSVTMLVLGSFLCDVLLLWRCRVIWMASLTGRTVANLAMAVPTLLVLASLGLGIAWDVFTAVPGGFYESHVARIGLAYFALTFVTNIVLTIMIIYRIWDYQSVIRKSLGNNHGSHYTSLTTMFIESAAMFSITSILVLGSVAANSTINQIFLGIEPGVQIMSSYFIIWRVAEGKAWSRDTIPASGGSIRFTKPSGSNTGGTMMSTRMDFSSNLNSTTSGGSGASGREVVSIPLRVLGKKQSWTKSEGDSGIISSEINVLGGVDV